MTIQSVERLHLEGVTLGFRGGPLDQWFELSRTPPPFEIVTSLCWRGYHGEWELVGDRLYLVGLSAELENERKANLATLFPDFPERVFAHWYTGEITIYRANRLESVREQPGADDDCELVLDLEFGVVTGRHLRCASSTPGAKA